MNAKKCKKLRRTVKNFVEARPELAGRALVAVPGTERFRGWKLPQGWLLPMFTRLMVQGGPWKAEAEAAAVKLTTVTLRAKTGTFRDLYQRAKRGLA